MERMERLSGFAKRVLRQFGPGYGWGTARLCVYGSSDDGQTGGSGFLLCRTKKEVTRENLLGL